jgi:hypothetical protein
MYPNRHQYAFLRKLRGHGDGLPSEHWPSAATWKRWQNHAGFRRAMKNLLVSIRVEEDLFVATAGARAGRMLHELTVRGDIEEVEKHAKAINALCRMVRVDHMRQKEVRGRVKRAKAPVKTEEPAKPFVYQDPRETLTVESAAKALQLARERLETAEIEAEMASLPKPFPDYRRGTALYYNPITNRREMPDSDVPAAEAGKGMDRVTRWFARHERQKAARNAAEQARREAIAAACRQSAAGNAGPVTNRSGDPDAARSPAPGTERSRPGA